VLAREFVGLSTVRPSAYFYTVYSIDWSVVDRTRQRIATRAGRPGPDSRITTGGPGNAHFADTRAGLY